MEEEDDFWSVAMHATANERRATYKDESDGEEKKCTSQLFTILPTTNAPMQKPMNIKLYCYNDDGILSDVSSSIWDAGLLLAGYLYGSHMGRQLCYNACFDGGCGILELGSGLGIGGLAATAAALSVHTTQEKQHDDARDIDTKGHNVVLTDRNNEEILAHLRKNVDANLDRIKSTSCNNNLSVSVEPCDWMDVSISLQTNTKIFTNEDKMSFPRGPFSLILGSALVYLPEHAAACADTIFYYLTNGSYSHNKQREKSLAVILQLPDRSGFSTHFLPRCHKLGLSISSHELEPGLIERVQRGLKGRKIPSASDYCLYFITRDKEDIKE